MPRSGATILAVLLAVAGCGAPEAGDAEPLVRRGVHGYAEVGGVTWHWVEAGSGPPVVLLHGLPESWYAWSDQIDALSDTYRVLAFDLKGFGLSTKAEGDHSVAAVATELRELLRTLGIGRYRLAGHDLGGMVAARLAGEDADNVVAYAHVAAPFRRLDLSRSPDLRDFHLDPDTAPELVRSTDLFVRRLLDTGVFGGSQALAAARVRRHVDVFARRGVPNSMERWFRDLDVARDGTLGPLARPDWGAMTFPVAALVGDRDLMVPLEEYLGLEEAIPGPARLVVVDDAGHYPHEEQPAAVSDILRHLFGS